MSGSAAAAAEGFLARYEGLRHRLGGDAGMRAAAAARFAETGLPGLRDEAWKYTSLRPLAGVVFHEPLTLLAPCDHLLALAPPLAGPRLVFCGGRYRADLSRPPAQAETASFAAAPGFMSLARPEAAPLVALNTMLAEDGARITVAAGTDGGTLALLSLAEEVQNHPVAFHPRHQVRLGAGARLVLLEASVGRGQYLHNTVFEVALEEGAALLHVRLQNESPAAFHLSTLYVRLAAGAVYDSFALNVGGRLARIETHATMGGAGAAVHLNGAQILGEGQHGDVTTVVHHDAPHGTSRQTVKTVLDGRARGVFQGRVRVAEGAQKTDGQQMNHALLLSEEAEIDSKPELEIFADDVKCSHGATVGEIDADQLFYLQSRGIPAEAARGLLVRAFLTEALDGIAAPEGRAMLDGAIEQWWQRQAEAA